jgi:hypothetical protein
MILQPCLSQQLNQRTSSRATADFFSTESTLCGSSAHLPEGDILRRYTATLAGLDAAWRVRTIAGVSRRVKQSRTSKEMRESD